MKKQRHFSQKILTSLLTDFFYITGLFLCAGVIALSSLDASGQAASFISKGQQIDINSFNLSINKLMNENGIPGVSLAIIENDKVVFSNFYGYRSMKTKANVDSATLFEACSLSKMYLLNLVYKMVEEGTLDLDKPMYKYLENKRLEHDPRYKLITPKMIINHTSGLENWQWMNDKNVLEILSNPGEKFVYSGEGYHYLADVIASILNEPYQSYLPRLVLTPEGLSNTKLNYTLTDSSSNISRGHNYAGKTLDKWITNEPWPASSVHTNAKSFSTLLLNMFNGQFLKESSVRKMTKDMKLINKDSVSRFNIGNGFFVLTSNADTIFNFAGQNTGFRSDMFYSKVNKRGFVFFTNSDIGLVMGPLINQLTTKLDIHLYFDSPSFRSDNYVSGLLKTNKNYGIQAMTEEIDQRAAKGEIYLDILEDLMTQFYQRDKVSGGKIALSIIKYNSESKNANAILGAVNLRIYHNYSLARSYLVKAKSLNYGGKQIEEFIKECDANLSIKQ